MKKVLVTGVSVIDFMFKLDQIPKESEKFRARDASISGGGIAANAAVAISKLGGIASLATRLGDDEIGLMIKKELIDEGVNIKFVRVFKEKKSSFSSVYIDKNGERQVVNYRDISLPSSPLWLNNIDKHDAYLADTRWNN